MISSRNDVYATPTCSIKIFLEIAKVKAAQSEFAEADRIVSQITDLEDQAEAIFEIVKAVAQKDLVKVKERAEVIEIVYYKTRAFLEIVTVMAKRSSLIRGKFFSSNKLLPS